VLQLLHATTHLSGHCCAIWHTELIAWECAHTEECSLLNESSHYIGWQKGCKHVKAEIHLKAVLWPSIMALVQIYRTRFKQSKISLLILYIYVSGCFVNFWVYLGINCFSQRICEIYRNRKFGISGVVLIRIWSTANSYPSVNLECPFGGVKLSVMVFQNFFSF